MNPSAANINSKRLPSEGEPGQRVPDVDSAGQQLRLKERRFFEEVFQHDVDMYLSSAHLTIRQHRRPPIGSISSMEVNVDLLDQMDTSDPDAFDVFFSSEEDSMLNSPLPDQAPGNNNNNNRHHHHGEVVNHGLFRHVLEGFDAKSRVSSTSSESSANSQSPAANGNGRDTPVVPSDEEEEEEEEETQGNAAVYGATPTERDAAKTPLSSTSS